MKKILLFSFAFAALVMGQFYTADAQVCVVDPQYTAAGIYPSDTLIDMEQNVATQQVVQFVFPSDTVLFGFTLPFDSFLVSSVTQIPAGLNWECNANHPTCHYVTTSGQLTRGCVKIYGTPTALVGCPAYDSIIVTGTAYVTVPFVGSQNFAQDISIYYRICAPVAVSPSMFANAGLQIAPMPVAGHSNVSYNLSGDANVKLSVFDVLGQEVLVLNQGEQRAGAQEVNIDATDLVPGAYYMKLNINDGEFVQTKKFMTIR